MMALRDGHLHVVIMLVGRGADLSWTTNIDWNMVHSAAFGGDRDCLEWVFANTTININSATAIGATPISIALAMDRLDGSKLLV
jgi:hypothetical protein